MTRSNEKQNSSVGDLCLDAELHMLSKVPSICMDTLLSCTEGKNRLDLCLVNLLAKLNLRHDK